MSVEMVIRSWKDKEFRATLEKSQIVANPAGDSELSVEALQGAEMSTTGSRACSDYGPRCA